MTANQKSRESASLAALLALAGVFGLTNPALVDAEHPEPTIPEPLVAAIRTVTPRAQLVSPQEVDATACAPVGHSPTMVRADFNGDRRDDYALLLKTRDTGRVTNWEGRQLRGAEFALVMFLADKVGGYRARVVREYSSDLPASEVLDLQSAGRVRHPETGKMVTLKNPGVTLTFCEKSATTYYLAHGELRSIPIAD